MQPRPVRKRDIKWRIYAYFDGDWEDISRDVLDGEGVAWDRGIDGNGPNDLTARAGTLTFTLNNSEANSVGIKGRWSPGHPFHKPGWDVGVPIRLDIAYKGRWVTQWIGRTDEILPEHGNLAARRVFTTAKDWMEEAAEHKLKGLATLDNVTAPEVIEELLSAMPIQPPGGTDFDEGLDTFPIVLDDVKDGQTTIMTVLSKINRSDLSRSFTTKAGALRYMNRNSPLASTDNVFVLDGTMRDVLVTRARKNIVNRIEVTVHPRRVSTEYAVLAFLDSQPYIQPGQTLPFRLEYIDPENPAERIGAIDIQVPLVANLDYSGSIQQALASGTPDTPGLLRPDGDGFYTGSGSAADLADESDSTGIAYPGAFMMRSVTLGDVSAANNAAVSGVRFKVRISYEPGAGNIDGSGYGGFFIFYPFLRSNSIDIPLKRVGTTVTHYDAYGPSGVHEVEFEVAAADLPTVASVNAMEFAWEWNIGGDVTSLSLVRVESRFLYAAAVEELDRTDDLSVATPNGAGGNATDFEVTNNGDEGVYLTRLQVRGRPVRKYDPVTSFVEDEDSIAAIGEKLVTIDQSYQADPNRGVQAAEYLLYLHGPRTDRAEQVQFLANLSEDHMNAALDLEIGERIGMSEEVTGLSAFTEDGTPKGWHIQHIAGRISPGPVVEMTWGLSPADSQQYWHVEVEGQSVLEESTTPGPL